MRKARTSRGIRRGAALVPALALAAALVSGPAGALTGTFLRESGRGWFWYEDPADVYEEQPGEEAGPLPAPPSAAAPAREEVPPPGRAAALPPLGEDNIDAVIAGLPRAPGGTLRAADLRAVLPAALGIAVDNPTGDNIGRYFRLQRQVMDKSGRFAENARNLVAFTPELDEFGRSVRSGELRAEESRAAREDLVRELGEAAAGYGLLYIYKGECRFCRMGVRAINALADEGFDVIGISLDGVILPDLRAAPGPGGAEAAAYYGIASVPAVVAVGREPGAGWTVVGEGLIPESELRRRLARLPDLAGRPRRPASEQIPGVQDHGERALVDELHRH